MERSLSLRLARPSDLAAVDRLLSRNYPRLLAADYPPSTLVTALPIISRARPELLASRRYYVVETESGSIVGAGGWSLQDPAQGSVGGGIGRTRGGIGGADRAGTGHVRHLVTDADWLRRGVARAIMAQVFSDALAQGVGWLDCLSTRTAVAFYASLGFRVINPVDVPLAPGIEFPAIRMLRQIRP